MRLTLRTMLAYLDGILDDDQAQELGEKIEESEFASGLVHRIRSVTRRLRLGVPTLEGRGMGLDPNTVSEYLENALPPERVPEIEKICLESDVHLAEVASCHQILILIESEPADVAPDLKDRVYLIGAPNTTRRASRSPGRTAAGGGTAGQQDLEEPPIVGGEPLAPPAAATLPPVPIAATALPTSRKSRDVPDYLRIGQSSRWKPLAITLVLAFVVSAVALRAMGPFDGSHPLLRLLGVSEAPEEVAQAGSGDISVEVPDGSLEPSPVDDALSHDAESGVDPTIAAPPAIPAATTQGDVASGSSSDAVDRPGDPVLPGPVQPGTIPQEIPSSPGTGQSAAAPPAAGVPEFPPTSPVVTEVPENPGGMNAAGPDQAAGAASLPTDPTPQTGIEVGYVKLTDGDFLVRYDSQASDWFRLPARSILTSGDRLGVFPTFGPEIVLTPGVQVSFAGASSVRTLAPGQQGEPTLMIDYGRVLIATAGVAGARIHLNFGRRGGTATFTDAASEMGVEVHRYFPPGADPEVEPAVVVVRMYTTIGSIQWQPDGVEAAIEITSGHARVIIADQAQTVPLTEAPAWIHGETTDSLDRLAKESLEPSVSPDEAVKLSLEEQSEGRRLEVRSLAARCLAYLESYDALIREFSDERQKSLWNKDFDVLRRSVSRSPESAASVRDALDRACGDDAADLYRLLWGYSPEELQGGSDRKLVDFLEHPSLSVRVFSVENLRRITDKTLGFRPELTADRRKSAVQDWQVRLENGEIVYETPPSAAIMDGQ